MLVDFISAQISAYNVLVVGLICVAFYSFLKILYRLYIHPLSKFPGPKIAAATSAFEFYHSVIRDGMFPWKIEELHKQYGKQLKYVVISVVVFQLKPSRPRRSHYSKRASLQ